MTRLPWILGVLLAQAPTHAVDPYSFCFDTSDGVTRRVPCLEPFNGSYSIGHENSNVLVDCHRCYQSLTCAEFRERQLAFGRLEQIVRKHVCAGSGQPQILYFAGNKPEEEEVSVTIICRKPKGER